LAAYAVDVIYTLSLLRRTAKKREKKREIESGGPMGIG